MKLATTALAICMFAPAALAQGQNPAASAPSKIGVLSVTGAIFNTAEGKQGLAELQSQFAPRQTEMQNLQRQIQDAQKRLTEGQNTLPDEEKNRLSRQIDLWTRSWQRKNEELQEEFAFHRNELGERILRKMDPVIDRFSRENAFALVIDISAVQVAYVDNTVDITQDIIRAYDAANPVGASAQTPRPATQPGQTRPRPPSQ